MTPNWLSYGLQYATCELRSIGPGRWPNANERQKAAIENAAQGVLDARAKYPSLPPSDLYEPVAMPVELVRAHAALDKAVEKAYGIVGATSDRGRVTHLFELNLAAVAPIEAAVAAKQSKRGKAAVSGAA
jgi:hypothetical protein